MKNALITLAKGLGIALWILAVIATCAAVWNAAEAATICIAAVATLITSGICIYKTAKKWFK